MLLMLKKHTSFLILSGAAALYPLSCLFKTQSALIGQITHAWGSSANSDRAAALNQFSSAKLAINPIDVWRGDVM